LGTAQDDDIGGRKVVGTAAVTDPPSLLTRGARWLRLPSIPDERGILVWAQAGTHLPFQPKRFWCIFDVPPDRIRGDHAHRSLDEILFCVQGKCTVTLDDGLHRDEVVLDSRDIGLCIPPLTWNTQRRFSRDAVLFVVASEVYRPDDYIRDYGEFLALAAHHRQAHQAPSAEPFA
jgi:UDP-2-acetamido-3-amino-2,3-dideoxy-glucuronate N-acetyltransferase